LARARCELALVPLERYRVYLPVKILVRATRKDASLGIQLDGLSPHSDALVLGAVPVGVVEEGLDPAGLLSVAIACSLRSAFRVAITGPDLAAA